MAPMVVKKHNAKTNHLYHQTAGRINLLSDQMAKPGVEHAMLAFVVRMLH
jgi:hypothetical protein